MKFTKLFKKFKRRMGWEEQPYFMIATDGDIEDVIDHMKIEQDWNPAFIKQLEKLGIKNADEQESIQQFCLMLFAMLSGFDFEAFEKQMGAIPPDAIQTLENGNKLRK